MRQIGPALAIFAAMVLVAMGENLSYQQDATWRAPAAAIARENPLASRPELSAGGRKLFQKNCAECHGADGTGMQTKRSADLQLPVVQRQTDGTLFWKITNGNAKKGMPSFSKLPEQQRWQVVLYLRKLKSQK